LALAIVASSSAAARTHATWKSITFTFTGDASGTFQFPPGRVGKSDAFNLKWTIVWRQTPNGGYAKLFKAGLLAGQRRDRDRSEAE
jgi:hypothetical protein